MNRVRLGFRISKIDIADLLRASALLLTILMLIAFFSACANREEADSNSVIRKSEGDHEIRGEVGATYGRGF